MFSLKNFDGYGDNNSRLGFVPETGKLNRLEILSGQGVVFVFLLALIRCQYALAEFAQSPLRSVHDCASWKRLLLTRSSGVACRHRL